MSSRDSCGWYTPNQVSLRQSAGFQDMNHLSIYFCSSSCCCDIERASQWSKVSSSWGWGCSHSHIRGDLSLPCYQLTLNWTEGLTWLRGSTQHPGGGGSGSPGGTWYGEDVFIVTPVGPESLSTGWCWTVPSWMCVNHLCAQLILERFNWYFSNDILNFSGLVNQSVGDVSCTASDLGGSFTCELRTAIWWPSSFDVLLTCLPLLPLVGFFPAP